MHFVSVFFRMDVFPTYCMFNVLLGEYLSENWHYDRFGFNYT